MSLRNSVNPCIIILDIFTTKDLIDVNTRKWNEDVSILNLEGKEEKLLAV